MKKKKEKEENLEESTTEKVKLWVNTVGFSAL